VGILGFKPKTTIEFNPRILMPAFKPKKKKARQAKTCFALIEEITGRRFSRLLVVMNGIHDD
jgi:hypothetical protein